MTTLAACPVSLSVLHFGPGQDICLIAMTFGVNIPEEWTQMLVLTPHLSSSTTIRPEFTPVHIKYENYGNVFLAPLLVSV